MQFQVPQFIEVEDTIVGPLTFKQFLYLAGGLGFDIILYAWLPIYLAIIPIIAVSALVGMLAFYQYNGRNFIYFVESAIKFFFTKKLYLWKRASGGDTASAMQLKTKKTQPEGVALPRLSASRLKDLAWSLDVQSGPENLSQNEG